MFEGFTDSFENWSKLPNELINALPLVKTLGEIKVILYVLRHTWGFQEFDDWEIKCITTDEFQNGRKRRDHTRLDGGVGMSRPSIYKGLDLAVEHGFMVKYVDNTDRGRVRHYFRLRDPKDTNGIIYAIDPDTYKPGITPWHTLSEVVKKRVYNRFQGRCAYCESKSTKWHYDHIVPQSRGGPHDFENIALSCPKCNLVKHNKTPDEWGHQVIVYEGDVKKLYRGWLKFFTGGGKETLPGGVKELDTVQRKKPRERNLEKETIDNNGHLPPSEQSSLFPETSPQTQPANPYREMITTWSKLFPDKPKPRLTTKSLQRKVATRMKEDHFRENWRAALERASRSTLCHTNGWFSFDFFIKNDYNYEKCLIGKYDNDPTKPRGKGPNGKARVGTRKQLRATAEINGATY